MEEELKFVSDRRKLIDRLFWKLSGVVIGAVLVYAAFALQRMQQTCFFLITLVIGGFILIDYLKQANQLLLYDIPATVSIDNNRLTVGIFNKKITYFWTDVQIIVREPKAVYIARNDQCAIKLDLENYRLADWEKIVERVFEIAALRHIPIRKQP